MKKPKCKPLKKSKLLNPTLSPDPNLSTSPLTATVGEMSKWWRATAGSLKLAVERPETRSYHTIQAIPREVTGYRISSRDRAQGRIPAVIFSQSYVQTKSDDPTSIAALSSVSRKRIVTTERKQIKAILNSVQLPFFCSTTFPLQIRAGSGSSTLIESGRVLPLKASDSSCTNPSLSFISSPLSHIWMWQWYDSSIWRFFSDNILISFLIDS